MNDRPICMRSAILGGDHEEYRYRLARIWDHSRPKVAFIGVNPSTADAIKDDNTIRRCVGYARSWGYGGIVMINLFAYRSTNPKALLTVVDPVGPDNDKWLLDSAKECEMIVAAWGNNGLLNDRWKKVVDLLPPMHYLELTKSGMPHHPLRLSKDLGPKKWKVEL